MKQRHRARIMKRRLGMEIVLRRIVGTAVNRSIRRFFDQIFGSRKEPA